MTVSASLQEPELREMPAGQLEYWCRESIRDLVRLYGFENARELVAIYLSDEADRMPQNGYR